MSTTKTDLLQDLQTLLDLLCTEAGFCNKLKPIDLFQSGNTLNSIDFAVAVLSAEGMIPDQEVRWKRYIRRKFTDRYGETLILDA